MIIRQMRPEDVKAVAEIERECFSMPWSEKAYSDTLQNADALYLVAETDKEAVSRIMGMCGMLKLVDEGDISNVAVHPDYRGRHVAKAMMTELLRRGCEMGIVSYTLEVRAGNEAAISLYRGLGFQVEGVRKRFYEKPVEDALIMWKR